MENESDRLPAEPLSYTFQQPVERSLITGFVWKFFYKLSRNVSFQQTKSLNLNLNAMLMFTTLPFYVIFATAACFVEIAKYM